jgi:PAS domain S-box-containing protein
MKEQNEHIFDSAVMLESMAESVLITDTELNQPGPYIIYVNAAFEKMTGWNRIEIIGKSPRILQGPNTDHTIFNDMKDTLEAGRVWSGKTLNYRKDGSEFHMQWSIVPVKDDHGKIIQYLAVQKDVTQFVLTEKRLYESMEAEKRRLIEIEKTNNKLSKLIAKQNKTLDLFKKYVPEPIVNKILKQKDEEIRQGEMLEAALLFCDIRSFTPIAEQLAPNQVVHMLNVYYSMMSEVIKKHNGEINQFVGDEIFVSFGAPLPIPQPEVCAVKCALGMINKLDEISKELNSIIKGSLKVGIGIHYGPIVAGNLGSVDRLSYSITGDAVNTAKRIESLSRKLPNAILISQPIYDKTSDIVSTNPWDEVAIKGKNEKIKIYQVMGISNPEL